jgi:hypothetical protein
VATGTLTVTAPLGAGLTYSIGGAYQSSATFSSVAPGSYTVTVKNSDGCISAGTAKVVDAQPATPAAPTLSVTQPTCSVNTGSITVTAPLGSGFTYNINGGPYQSGTTFSGLLPNTYSVRSQSAEGCISQPAATVLNTPECLGTFCTYTQGYYGSNNGKSCDGVNTYNKATELIRSILGITSVPQALNPIVVGVNSPGGYSITIPATDAAATKLNRSLPGGKTPGPLTALGNCVITDACFSQYLTNNGKIVNNLLSQTIVLTMNSRMNNNLLASFRLQLGWLVTRQRSGCGILATEVNCSSNEGAVKSFRMDEGVINYLTANGTRIATVTDLLALANRLLGRDLTPGAIGPDGIRVPSYSAILSVIDAINNGFDGCRRFIGYSSCEKTCANLSTPCVAVVTPVYERSEVPVVTIKTFPNPVSDKVSFMINSPQDGKATIKMYNSIGEMIGVVFQGDLTEGRTRQITYTVPGSVATGNLFYVFEQNGKRVSGKLIKIK